MVHYKESSDRSKVTCKWFRDKDLEEVASAFLDWLYGHDRYNMSARRQAEPAPSQPGKITVQLNKERGGKYANDPFNCWKTCWIKLGGSVTANPSTRTRTVTGNLSLTTSAPSL